MLFWFVCVRYVKPTMFILLGLELFFVSIDSMQYFETLSNSINTALLFLAFDAMLALNYVLPLSLLLGLIVFYIGLIRSNQYVALLSLGYSRRQILYPPLLIIIFFVCIYIGLNATSFAYSQENAERLVSNNSNISKDLFIRYNDDYVFFEKIYPLLQKAEGIKIYHTKNENGNRILSNITQANEGFFVNNEWNIVSPKVYTMPLDYKAGGEGFVVEYKDSINILKGFKPKVLDTLYNNKPSVSLTDAFYSLNILLKESADTKRTRGIIYSLALIPFFIPMVAIIIAYYVPPLARYGNLVTIGITSASASLMVWGVFFSLSKLNANAIFIPEIGILIPLALLLMVSIWHYIKIDKI